MEYKPNIRQDSSSRRSFMDDEHFVLHCHHYSSLFTQLAIDAKSLNGIELFVNASEETFYSVFKDYMERNNVQDREMRIKIVEDYFRYVGLGLLTLTIDDNGSATAVMKYSHLDEAWLSKWEKNDEPINFVGWGLLQAGMSAITNSGIGTYQVDEAESLVSGERASVFNIKRKGGI